MRKLMLTVVAVFLLSSAPCRAGGFFFGTSFSTFNTFNPVVVDNGFSSTVLFVPNNRVFFNNNVVVRQQDVVVRDVARVQPVVVKQKVVIRRGLFR